MVRNPPPAAVRFSTRDVGCNESKREMPGSFSIQMNDYGSELLCAQSFDWERAIASRPPFARRTRK
ncbi:hypothetical protein BN2475_1290023 [Paraburkholderia ribeironis]|uniref:Uncharacterized protein n=1 Tax=Paraburkholderia ribeironis TaxID=1247936 RepID=A0A1N7SP59_9BURK|nr:hypothetical protein BN2475_1290023 [Paraburkholderia ribeironis]